MWGFLFLASTLFVGYQLTHFISQKWYKLEFFAAAYVVGVVITTWAAFLGAAVLNYSIGVPLALCFAILGSYAISKYYFPQRKQQFEKLTASLRFSLITQLVFWTVLLWFLFTTRLFIVRPDGWYSGGTTWADLALHSTFIHAFADQQKLDLTSPVYATEKTTYPFLFDFNTALYLRSGFTLQDSLVLTSILMTLSFIIVCFFFVWRLTGSLFVANLSNVLFFFNSNLGSYYFFKEWGSGLQTRWEFLQELTKNYVHYPEKNLHWAQFITDYLLPQRGILLGLSVFILALLILPQATLKHQKSSRLALGVLLGLMPFFHIHTFLVLLGITGWCVLWSVFQKKTSIGDWIITIGTVVLFASPQLYWQFSQTYGSGFSSFTNGWYAENESILLFWMRNLGLEFFLTILGIIYAGTSPKAPSFLKIILLPLSTLFVLCNFIIFQPNPWDNTKFMIYSHFIFVVVTLLVLRLLWLQKVWGKMLTVLAIITLTFGGALAVVRELETNWLSANLSDLTVAAAVREQTLQSDRFLTADTHNHPIPMLTGRPVLMGYRGWLWTYGIDYKPVETDVYKMFAGASDTKELFKKYNISYVYIGPRELAEFGANEAFYRQFPIIFSSDRERIYKVN